MKSREYYRVVLMICMLACMSLVPNDLAGQVKPKTKILENNKIRASFTIDGLLSLTDPTDKYHADVVSNKAPWGTFKLTYRTDNGIWKEMTGPAKLFNSGNTSFIQLMSGDLDNPVTVIQRYSLNDKGLDYDITINIRDSNKVEIGDLALNLPWHMAFDEEDPEYIFEKSFTKHHFISGDGSFIYFTKPSGEPPFLMVLPEKGTKLEYFDGGRAGYRAFIHSAVSGKNVVSGTWLQKHTSLILDRTSGDSTVTYGFKLLWAHSWDEMRQCLYDEGLFDIRVVPGMTIPVDLSAQFSLHTKNTIDSIIPEYPDKTTLKYLGEKQPDNFVFEVGFRIPGENMLTVYYGKGQKTYLEFFSTEPLETLIKKRSAFIVNSTQHRDTSLWYNGLFSAYDMKNGVLRGPDNTDGYDGWWGYVLACDDPGLCKAPYVAAKNVFYPDEKEIAAVEYYLKEFVWNGLQRTDKDDPYPYGIYGVPNWKVARDSVARAKISTTNLDKMHIWRSYDYPHIIMLYYHMYQIAKMYPGKVHYLDASGYLERAWQTARAYFIYPDEILPWYETYKWGCYNELVIEKLIDDLNAEGRVKEAQWLKNEYEKKVKYFIYDDKYPFRSEYAIDRTAFESAYAFARYGTLNDMLPDTNLWYDKNKDCWYSHPVVTRKAAREFMERQLYASLAVRGWLEAKYFLLGSDFTYSSDSHCLSYMARMGGWSILDYGINFAEKPCDWLQLGYASYLAPFALMNTGTAESNYGYWFPGKQNDGAMGWAFMESKHAYAWIRKEMDRGAWFYDGEADLGNGAIFRMAQTILSNDPLFGWIAYGGTLTQTTSGFKIIPQDGVRNRFSVVTDNKRITVSLNRDGFKADKEICVSGSLNEISLLIENRSGDTHNTCVEIENHFGRNVILKLDGKDQPPESSTNGISKFVIHVINSDHLIEILAE